MFSRWSFVTSDKQMDPSHIYRMRCLVILFCGRECTHFSEKKCFLFSFRSEKSLYFLFKQQNALELARNLSMDEFLGTTEDNLNEQTENISAHYFTNKTYLNETSVAPASDYGGSRVNLNIISMVTTVVGAIGFVSNGTVILALGSHRKYRRKIPNKFIINQVFEISPGISCFLCLAFLILQEI